MWAQPLRVVVTVKQHLLLVGHIPRLIPPNQLMHRQVYCRFRTTTGLQSFWPNCKKLQNICMKKYACAIHAFLHFVAITCWLILPISFRVASVALGQAYDCPSASEATLKDMGKRITAIHDKMMVYPKHIKHTETEPVLWDLLHGLI